MVRVRQLFFAVLFVVLLPGMLALFAGSDGQGQGFAVIGGVIGSSIAAGRLVSGIRR